MQARRDGHGSKSGIPPQLPGMGPCFLGHTRQMTAPDTYTYLFKS